MAFPLNRYRRLRLSESLRAMVRETTLDPADFIAPMFVVPGEGVRQPIPSMPGIDRVSPDLAAEDASELAARGVLSVILFGIPDHKDAVGSPSADLTGPVCRAVETIKAASPATVVMTDVCLCEYTDHGHCGVIVDQSVDNDATLPILAAEALAHARAGADVVAPSDMMDGRVRAIRDVLDASGYRNVPILSYAAKYASGFYGPFREAAESTPAFGDRRAYQMDPANVREAVKEILSDVEEGADMVMVKPALSYLDVVRAAKEVTNVPLATYNVSGEYAMVKAAAERGWIDGKRVTLEILTSMKRAGADLILTYHAKEAAEWLQGR
ncbi:MAG TPA: porphobilinogen synthase [Thermoanaerobaculia bacterium]|nr:porphobilinogen synthase [Thermoanaerobaculia bacterium]HQP85341.1 porphobilinogen synthase [Thermoanaerobaculia bacterium]